MFTAVGQIDSRSETTGIQLNPLGQTSQGRWVLHPLLLHYKKHVHSDKHWVWTGLVRQLISIDNQVSVYFSHRS